ncbi:MAG: GntR family transcriptional regulator [Pirellulales bacterium]|nr:GntR family transcriptional regulator [Pirellulales bacterium]
MPSLPSPKLATQKVARHAVRDYIARRIATGQYQPGTKLVQNGIAQELGVSRAVVREAIFELLGMGLVETNDNRGAVVTEFNMARLLECYELREILEGLAARRCCDRITVKQLRELHDLIDEIHRLHVDGDHEQSARLDRKFHLALTRIADNRLVEKLSGTYAVLGKVVTIRHADPEQTYTEHQAILNHIQSGNHQAAENAARLHVHKAYQAIQQRPPEELGLQWIA